MAKKDLPRDAALKRCWHACKLQSLSPSHFIDVVSRILDNRARLIGIKRRPPADPGNINEDDPDPRK